MKLFSALLAGALASTSSAYLRVASKSNIPTTAANNGSFDTLVATLTAADLVTALSAEGPFTVFAPTDDAFKALEDANNGITTCLLKPENKQALTDILLYHVASGQVFSTDLEHKMRIDTLLGEDLKVKIRSGTVSINDSTVIIPDVPATNGVIHAIDSVLVPDSIDVDAFLAGCLAMSPAPAPAPATPIAICSYMGESRPEGQMLTGPTHTCTCGRSGRWYDCYPNTDKTHTPMGMMTIEQFAVDSDRLTTLETAIAAAGLLGVLDGEGPFTVFAPSDDAFSRVPPPLLDFLLDPENKAVLASVLQYHIVGGASVEASALSDGDMVETLLKDEIEVEKVCWSQEGCDEFSLSLKHGIGSSYVVAANVDAENGIVHIIDNVLIPPSLAQAVAEILA